ncbi:MAG TPA: FtsQ-type POTRA domain-containing protein [Gaiellaceae bacterium]|nr:FtsQ-type POTRA domain-containing protein [Gaiellaceae bacterium]
MVKRPHLKLVPGNGLRPRLRAPSRRSAGLATLALALVGLLYLGARETSLFALRELEVSGAPPGVARTVETAAGQFAGESLVALDRDDLRRSLEALPTVRAVELDRAFPHTLRVAVEPELPLAVLRQGQAAWLLSERGRVMRKVEPGAAKRPQVRFQGEDRIAAGDLVETDEVALALAVLRRVPDNFPVRIQEVAVSGSAITLVLADGGELRLGERTDLPLKLEVAGRVLRLLTLAERQDLAYVDVTLPERPVGRFNTQPSS